MIISTFLISTIFFIDNVEAKTVSYVYNDTEYNFDIDELAQTYGHEATGNYVLTANSGYFKKGEDIENLFILIEIKNSILTLEPTISDVGTNNKINGTIYFANVSSTTYSENDSSTLSIKYNLASKEFSIKYFPLHWKVFFCFAKKKCVWGLYLMLNVIQMLRNR